MMQEVVMVLMIIALLVALFIVVIKRAFIDYYKAVIGK
jgi:hypothetical protein